MFVELFWETCTSSDSAAVWAAEYHTPLVRPVATGLERSTRLRPIFRVEGRPSPIDFTQALGGNAASHLCAALHPRLSMFGMETPRDATPARRLSTCRPRREHLPSSSIAPPLVGRRRLQDRVCLAVPELRTRGGETERLSLSLPFDRLI
jgi:hypothetical protein